MTLLTEVRTGPIDLIFAFVTIGLSFALTLVGFGISFGDTMDSNTSPQSSEPSSPASSTSTSSNCMKIDGQLKSEPQNQKNQIFGNSCNETKNGDVVITSKPVGTTDMDVQSLISKKVEESIKDYQAGFHAGYSYGVFTAQLGDGYYPGSPKPTTFSQG